MMFDDLRKWVVVGAVTAALGFGVACTAGPDADPDAGPEVGEGIAEDDAIGTGGAAVNNDDRIEEELDRMFTEDDAPDLDERDLRFDVNNGVVTIEGEIETAAERQQVEDRVRSVAGVTAVVNELEVQAGS
jgi:hypothetical protein